MYDNNGIGYAGGWVPQETPKQIRMNYFNLARGLFPYSHTSGTDPMIVSADEVIEAAEKICKYIEGDTEVA